MKIIQRNSLRRGGFAGLRETRLVMSPKLFRGRQENGTVAGLGRFVYLADARFLPFGETRMHRHREVDVVSVVVEGRVRHEGSLQDGLELTPGSVLVQRAGGEGFSHNEINPDPTKNRMIQLWVLPESPGQAADARVFSAPRNGRGRVYGGPPEQELTLAARTVIDIAQLEPGEHLEQAGRCIAYVTTGEGHSAGHDLAEGDLAETRNFRYTASAPSQLILVYTL